MSDDLSPVEQARAARWAAGWLNDGGWNSQFAAASAAVDALKRKTDELDPPESVESLRAERDEALAEMEEVGAFWRQEQIMHQKAWDTIRILQAEVARLRDTHVEAEAARGRCKPDRVWHHNDPEPDGVNRVTDIDGDEWGKANGKWRHPHAGPSRSWANLLNAYGPLTEVISR